MAAYLASIGSDPRAVRERRPPALGAGQAAATPTEAAAKPTHGTPAGGDGEKPTAAAEPPKPAGPRRPSDSIELGKLPVAALSADGQEGAAAQTAAAPPTAPHPAVEFEE